MRLLPRPASRGRGNFFGQPVAWLLVVLTLTVLVYLPGLHGPFLFDDTPNLRPLQDWLDGTISWIEVLLGNRSGPFGRPLSLLSFMANAKLFGMAPFSFKLTNLLIHLVCGSLIFLLMQRLLHRDRQWNQRADVAALLIAAAWLLHPLQVSTVLYVVQRMAQLSTLFILLALLAYVRGREVLEHGSERAALKWLFLAVPAATIVGMLCKENAALAPLLCGVLELGYFRDTAGKLRSVIIKAFFLLGLALPVLALILWYAWPPSRLLAEYSGRTFTLGERLLSEPRALFDYVGTLLLPRGPTMGLYTDDFAVSHDLFQPISTLAALTALLLLIAGAIAVRKHVPAVFTGIAFFLAGHVMESSVFPLELYFEHRNYLPSVGIFLTLAGALGWLIEKLPASQPGSRRSRWWLLAALAVCTMLATATAARAWVWQSWSVMVKQAVRHHPGSTRAQLDNLSLIWNTRPPRETHQLLTELIQSGNPALQHVATIVNLQQQCQENHAVSPQTLIQVRQLAGIKLQLADMQAFDQIGVYLRTHECAGLSKTSLADLMIGLTDAAPQPLSNGPVWRVRFMATDLYARDGSPVKAQMLAAQIWATGAADPAVGVMLARLQIFNNQPAAARRTLAQLIKKIPAWNRRGQVAIADIKSRLLK